LPAVEGKIDAASDLALLLKTVQEAGRIALASFRRDPKVWLKMGRSPVSEVDLAVDRQLGEQLRGARPDYGWLSEETGDTPERLTCSRVFVVDPIDGTWAYITGRKDWAVSAAVVEHGRPVAVALYAPARGELYAALKGGGTHLGDRRLSLGNERRKDGSLRIAGPRKLVGRLRSSFSLDPNAAYVSSLALRIAAVAAGHFDVALAGANSHDWDLAAADLIVEEAQGRLTSISGDTVVYNRAEPVHPPLVAAAEPLHASVLELLGEAAEGSMSAKARE